MGADVRNPGQMMRGLSIPGNSRADQLLVDRTDNNPESDKYSLRTRLLVIFCLAAGAWALIGSLIVSFI